MPQIAGVTSTVIADDSGVGSFQQVVLPVPLAPTSPTRSCGVISQSSSGKELLGQNACRLR